MKRLRKRLSVAFLSFGAILLLQGFAHGASGIEKRLLEAIPFSKLLIGDVDLTSVSTQELKQTAEKNLGKWILSLGKFQLNFGSSFEDSLHQKPINVNIVLSKCFYSLWPVYPSSVNPDSR